MKFIVDAQLPFSLAAWISEQGYDVLHTLQLPDKNLTPDHVVIEISVREQRVVISKDSDFYEYYVLRGQPHKLLIISTGNIVNKQLIALFEKNFEQLVFLFRLHSVIEMNNHSILVHY